MDFCSCTSAFYMIWKMMNLICLTRYYRKGPFSIPYTGFVLSLRRHMFSKYTWLIFNLEQHPKLYKSCLYKFLCDSSIKASEYLIEVGKQFWFQQSIFLTLLFEREQLLFAFPCVIQHHSYTWIISMYMSGDTSVV